jgi:glycosyltransferase 2 family protein
VKKGTLFQIAGAAVLAGGGLYVSFRGVNLGELWGTMRETPWWVLAALPLLQFLTLWLRAVRWRIILPQSQNALRRDYFGLVMIGFLVNNFLPARLGEAVRVFLLWKRNRYTAAESIGSVALERLFDIQVFASFLFVPVFCLPALHKLLPVAWLAAGGFAATVFGLTVYALFPLATKKRAKALLSIVPERIRPRVARFGAELMSNLDWLFSLKKSVAVIALSFLMVFCHPLMIILLVNQKSFGALGGMFASAAAAIGAAIPLSPGYVGTLHAALTQGLSMVGIGKEISLAVAVLYHAAGYFSVTALGLFFFFKLKISMQDITGAKKAMAGKKETSSQ